MKSAAPLTGAVREPYRKDIDGLRAIAVTAVVLYHTGWAAVAGGFVGVDVFFVISGYLIGAHIYRDVSAGRFSLARFYQRRAKRILPALFMVLLFCYAMAMMVLAPGELKLFADYAMAAVGSVSNLFAARSFDYFAKAVIDHPLLMTWSLGVEEQFYVFCPLVLMGLGWGARRCRLNGEATRRMVWWVVMVVAVVSLCWCVRTTEHARMRAFFLLPSRAWELAVGVLMAVYEARGHAEYSGRLWGNVRGWAGLAAVLVAVFGFGAGTVLPGYAAALPVAGAGLLLSAPEAWVNRRVLSLGPVRGVGLVSYSWYLWHWPLLSFANIAVAGPLPVRTGMAVVVVALGCAWVSWRFVEKPFRESELAPWQLLWRYAVVAAFVTLPAVVMQRTGGLPGRYPVVAAQETVVELNPHACFGRAAPDVSDECWPKEDGRAAVALYGDSHASALGPEMLTLAAKAGVRLVTVAHTSCPPLVDVVRRSVDTEADRECSMFNRSAVRALAADASLKTVVVAALWAGPALDPPGFGYVRAGSRGNVTQAESAANFERGLEDTVAALRAAGKRVVLMEDVAPLKFDPVGRVETYLMPVRRALARVLAGKTSAPGVATAGEMYGTDNAAANAVLARVAERQGAELFDVGKGVCTEAACTYFVDGLLMYRDQNHISRAGAEVSLRDFRVLDAR